MIKFIIFDLDGVLVEAKEIHYKSLNLALGDKYKITIEEHLSTYDGLKTLMVKNKRLWYNKILLSDFTIDLEGVIEYVKLIVYYDRNKDENIGTSFLHSVKNIDSIKFDKSISMFHDINDIFIIFHQKIHVAKSNLHTKKIFINPNTKKRTKRKELKEMNT